MLVQPSAYRITSLTKHKSSDTCTTDQMRTGRSTGPYGHWRPPLETPETGEWRPRCHCHSNGTRCDLPALSPCYRNGTRRHFHVVFCTWCSPSCRCPCEHCDPSNTDSPQRICMNSDSDTWSDTGSDTESDAGYIIIEAPAQPNGDPGRHGITISTAHGTANYNLPSDASPGDGIADYNVSSDLSSITQPLGVTNSTMVQPPQPLGVTNSSVSDSQQPASVTHTPTSAPGDRDSTMTVSHSDGDP